jgi:type IV/VI secretion system ImpK/VasF family protein
VTLTDVCSDLFLFLVTFRRQVRKGMNPDVDQTRRQLLEIFSEQERRVRDDAKLARLYEQVKYILVVLADEILINSNWSFSRDWEEKLLEWEFFKTRVAGEEFFTRLEKEGERDEALAEIYYIALCLGFVGMHADEPTKIVDLKRRLYRMLPDRLSESEDRITPEAYYVAEGVKDPYQPLVNMGRIAVICAALFVGIFITFGAVRREVKSETRERSLEMKKAVAPIETGAIGR